MKVYNKHIFRMNDSKRWTIGIFGIRLPLAQCECSVDWNKCVGLGFTIIFIIV